MTDLVHSQNFDNRRFSPAMPVMTIGLTRTDGSGRSITFDALVDTGADGTLIPSDLLDAPYVDRAYLRGVTGQRERVDLFLVAIDIGSVRVTGIRAAAIAPGEFPILGRDVLNHLRLSLDGPAEMIEVYS